MTDVLRINGPRRLILAADGDDHIEITNRTSFRLLQPAWDDLRMPASGINPPGAASDPTLSTSTGLWGFAAAATNTLALQVQLPHHWKEGSTLHPHVHWMPSTTNVGNVLWRLEYKKVPINGVLPAEYTPIDVLAASGGVADTHLISEFPEIAMTGQTLSTMLVCLLSRIGGDGTDTFTGVATLLEFDIHYQVDGFGSADEYLK
jgi:hypothetical protein